MCTDLSRTIGHPDFSDIIPTATDYDPYSATSSGSLKVANPNIEPYKVMNLDLTGKSYLKSSSVHFASLFQERSTA